MDSIFDHKETGKDKELYVNGADQYSGTHRSSVVNDSL